MNSKEQKNAKYNRHSYSQILNADNSIFLDLEIQDPLKISKSEPQNDKRKSFDDDLFKSPGLKPNAKRRKSINKTAEVQPKDDSFMDSDIFSTSFFNIIAEKEESYRNKSLENSSKKDSSFNVEQYFTQDSFINQSLTQAKDCVKDAVYENDKFDIIDNPETCSQYLRIKPDSDEAGPSRMNSSKYLPVSSIFFKSLGPFFGLTTLHKQYILNTKKINDLYDWQKECLNLKAIHERTNLIYALPTSGGKTLVAEIAMYREVLLRNKNVIFVLPYVSIVQEKVQDLTPFAVEFNFLIEEYCAGKGSIPPVRRGKKNVIYICTIEKSLILFDSLCEQRRLKEIGMIVVDELHLLGDEQRGYVLESLLTKAVRIEENRIQIIGMSATISNLPEVAKFLKADIYTRDFRPVELTEYVKIGSDIFSINPSASCASEAFQKVRSCGANYQSSFLKKDPDHLVELIVEVCPKYSCLIFCATKDNCENVAKLLSDNLPIEIRNYMKTEKKNLIEAIKSDLNGQICPTLSKTLPFGIAYHHSGLTSEERRHIEEAYRFGVIKVICCTSTLAAGVNLPAKRVIIRSPYIGRNFISLTKLKQMVGRAGRAGKCDAGESIVICDPRDVDKLTNLLCSKMDETISGYVNNSDGKFFKTTILNLVGIGSAKNLDGLVDHFKNSLFNVQLERTGLKLREHLAKHVKELVDEKAMTFNSVSVGFRNVSFETSSGQEVFPDDDLDVSMLGKAAVNAGMTLDDAKKVDKDLRVASMNFVLAQHLHLLYIVVPDDNIQPIRLDYNSCNSIMLKLSASFMRTARVIGINEPLCVKMVTRPSSIKESEQFMIKKFYVALMLNEMWSGREVYEVATKYKVNRGIVFGLMSAAASKAFSLFKFCEVIDEFWAFRDLLEKFSRRLSYCCSNELLDLMELPGVKIGRAKMMYNAGIKTVADVAQLTPSELIASIKHVNSSQAAQIIKAAKHSILEKFNTIHEQAEELKNTIKAVKAKDASRSKL